MNQNYYRIVDEDVTEIANSDLPWEKLKGKTVLITGANGYLPSYMVFTLLKRNDLFHDGIHIVALCRNEEKARDRFEPMLDRSDLEFLIQDVCDPIQYDKKVDVVVHAASLANPYDMAEHPVETFWGNVAGAKNILEFCCGSKSSENIIFSAGAVYGINNGILSEVMNSTIDVTNPKFAYGLGKMSAELLAASYSLKNDLNYKVVRPFVIYGPGAPMEHKKFYTDFAENIKHYEDIVLKSDGMAKRSMLYLGDAIEAIFVVLLKGKSKEAYNIAGDTVASVYQVAELMATIGGVNIKVNFSSDNYLKASIAEFVADCSKLKGLGWYERTGLRNGLYRYLCSLGIRN